MAHEIEMVNGVAQMAYVGDTPWHGLGKRVPADLTPEQMLEAAGLDWTVEKVPAYVTIDNKKVSVNHSALVRSSDNQILDVVSNDWNPVQNLEAFEFFNDFVIKGDMEMHTAGSLKGGQIVWALAKVKESFDVFGGDTVESYLHFSNFHKYGFSTDVRFTPIRVVCNNTLTLSLNTKVDKMAKVSHRRVFDGDNVKMALGIAKEKLATYKEVAVFLGSKRYNSDHVIEYFNNLFPITGNGKVQRKELSKQADRAIKLLDSQPGTEFAPGSFWQLFNATTYMTDHVSGKTVDNRLHSAWYGQNKILKTKALDLAIEMAETV